MNIKFVLQDFWIGLYWKSSSVTQPNLDIFCEHQSPEQFIQTTWYLCIIPCFPIIWETYRKNISKIIPSKYKHTLYFDISDYCKSPHVLAGRIHGATIRNELNLDKIDQSNTVVIFGISDEVWSLNSSFFCGMFQESVNLLGEIEFKKKYKFQCSPAIRKDVDFNTEQLIDRL